MAAMVGSGAVMYAFDARYTLLILFFDYYYLL